VNAGKETSWRALRVGIVLTLAIFLLVLAVVNANFLSRAVTQRASLYTWVPAVNGLRSGAPVWLQGVEIGSVRSISLQPEGVVIKLGVKPSVLRIIRNDAEASILTWGLLGNKYIELSRGSVEKPLLRNGDTLPGKMAPGLDKVMEVSIGSAHLVEEFIRKLDTIAGKAASGKGMIGALLTDTILYKRLNYVAGVIARNIAEYDTGRGSFKRFLTDDSFYNVAVSAASQLDSLGFKVNKGTGSVARMVNDSTIYTNLTRTLLHLQMLEDTLTASAELFNKIGNKQFAEDLEKTVVQLKGLIEDIKKNPKRYFKISVF
jgi:phospholipid/cholesterol/gamma-HCH transport system substrate-binding protein